MKWSISFTINNGSPSARLNYKFKGKYYKKFFSYDGKADGKEAALLPRPEY